MSNMLADAADWLADQLQGHAGTSGTYRRGVDSVALVGSLSHRQREVQSSDGFVRTFEGWDLIVPAADLVLDAATVLPRRGDTWERELGSQTVTYEVLGLPGEDVYDAMDADGVMLRIHLKEKSRA